MIKPLLIAAAVAAPLQAQTAIVDSAFTRHLAYMARQRGTQLLPPATNQNQRVSQQYQDALTDLDRGAFGDAATTLQAVLHRDPQNPVYTADLAYAQLRLGQFEEASRTYSKAYQLQPQNAWLFLGVATGMATQRHYADAAQIASQAAHADSALVDSAVAGTVAGWYEAAGNRDSALAWARTAARTAPGDAVAWFRVAVYLVAKGDTTGEGMNAIRHYLVLRPGDKRGGIVYANYLIMAGQMDSAVAIATDAAADSTNRSFAAQVLYQAAAVNLRRDPDKAIRLLSLGSAWADSTQRAGYANTMGRAQMIKLPRMFAHFEDYPSCDTARILDTLVSATERNLRAGLSFDSARTRMIVDSLLPPYKGNAQAALHNCKTAAQLQPPPQPQRRPAARPRPARP